MEFKEKIQTLRKQNGLTQEQLADKLFVSRTAVSKWESGRGYPSIDTLKRIAEEFSLSVDELLSGDELLLAAEQDNNTIKSKMCDLVFGLMDIGTVILLFTPFANVSQWIKSIYFVLIAATVLFGIITLALQTVLSTAWIKLKGTISFILNIAAVLIFILSRQPYAAALTFVFLIIKAFLFVKKRRH